MGERIKICIYYFLCITKRNLYFDILAGEKIKTCVKQIFYNNYYIISEL